MRLCYIIHIMRELLLLGRSFITYFLAQVYLCFLIFRIRNATYNNTAGRYDFELVNDDNKSNKEIM